MPVNPKIFKKYDLRGAYPEELNDEMAYEIGRGFAVYAKSNTLMVGYDARVHSPALKDAVIRGITDQGVNVVNIGLCSTPCFYFTLAESGLGGGIMVTASHAPKQFNGFKPMFKDAVPLTKEQVLEFKETTMQPRPSTATEKGKVSIMNPLESYVAAVRKSIKEKIKPLKVIMDSGNGTAGLYIDKVFANTNLSVISMFPEPDGNFPNHETNPKIPENRVKLQEKIRTEKADLGFMFDGDADRLYIFDRNGNVIDPSLIMAIISEYLIKNSSNKKVTIEVRTSRVLYDWVKRAGGNVKVSSCWTIPIKLAMKADPEVVFGGETSGHYVFPAMHVVDDAIFGALTFLQAISIKNETIDDIIANFKKEYFVLDEQNFKVETMPEAAQVLGKLKGKYSSAGAQILEIDGLSVVYPNWWFNLRKSETEPYIRLNLEANSQALFDEKRTEVTNLIRGQ